MEASAQVIPPVVAALADSLARVLGKRLVGVYLGGSISMGDFAPATSDFDVLIVTEGHLAPQDIRAIDALHRRLARDDSDARRLDGDYAPRHLLVPQGTRAPVPGFQRGHFAPDVQEIMLSAARSVDHQQPRCSPPSRRMTSAPPCWTWCRRDQAPAPPKRTQPPQCSTWCVPSAPLRPVTRRPSPKAQPGRLPT
jgi:hypothetical protein